MRQSGKQLKRNQTDDKARLVDTMLHKLELNPHGRYEEVLNVEEYNEAVLMIRAAVAYVQGHLAAQRYKGRHLLPPSSFKWHGCRYPLLYSNLGRVFIATKRGMHVIGSGYDVI